VNNAFEGKATESRGILQRICMVFISIQRRFIDTPRTNDNIKLVEADPVNDLVATLAN